MSTSSTASTVSLLEQELGEQPEVAARLLDRTRPRLADLGALLRSRGTEQVLLVARGSSDNAARYACYLWESPDLAVAPAMPSLTSVYSRGPALGRRAVVAVSQSGRSPDVVGVVEQARAAGRPTLAVTNDPDSPLARAADAVLDLGCGPERSVAATKTYTASVLAMALLGCALDSGGRREADLAAVPEALAAAVARTSGVAEAAALVAGHDRGISVGRGLNLATAHEIGLKVTELTGALVAPYSPADLLHGPVAAVGPGTPVLLTAPAEPASASVLALLPELRRRGAPVVLVGSRASLPDDAGAVRVVVPVDALVAPWLTPVVAVVPGQLVAWHAAVLRGVDVDRPGELSKVTLTR